MPFVKLVTVLIAGILSQYYLAPNPGLWLIFCAVSLSFLVSFFGFTHFRKYSWSLNSGIASLFLFYSLGGLLTVKRDITKDRDWFGHYTETGGNLLAVADEPAVEKTNSYKFTASIISLSTKGKNIPVRGRIFVYIKKSAVSQSADIPQYGTQIILPNDLKPITGFDNPGGFDYGRYCRLKGITHQVFLDSNDYIILQKKKIKTFPNLIHKLRVHIVRVIRTYIPGKKEAGLAEALLIGYKQDLDKTLVQAYSDTGVVHIIAISGLHVGLIYWLLSILLRPLRKAGYGMPAALFTTSGLWLFSFLAGAQPSILRAALMFSCIIIAREIAGKTSTYNTIAFSAFVLLCIDPFWLWDAGFQLSYAAVVGIIAFMKPIYGLVYTKNKLLDQIWKMNAVTLAAQVFTLPICFYYFHQFPNYFLVTNFVAVPLSTIILLGEIVLLAFSFFPYLAFKIGGALTQLLEWMNSFVRNIASLPFATWESLQISIPQTLILLLFASASCFGIMEKSRSLLRASAFLAFIFFGLRFFSFDRAARQEMIIVYNVPRHTAIDLVRGRTVEFLGDSILNLKGPEREQYLDPSRCFFRTTSRKHYDPSRFAFLTFSNKRIWRIDRDIEFGKVRGNPDIDLLILSGNPKLYLPRLVERVRIHQVVIDPTVPKWKTILWKKDCKSLSIPCHDVSTEGAFVMTTR